MTQFALRNRNENGNSGQATVACVVDTTHGSTGVNVAAGDLLIAVASNNNNWDITQIQATDGTHTDTLTLLPTNTLSASYKQCIGYFVNCTCNGSTTFTATMSGTTNNKDIHAWAFNTSSQTPTIITHREDGAGANSTEVDTGAITTTGTDILCLVGLRTAVNKTAANITSETVNSVAASDTLEPGGAADSWYTLHTAGFTGNGQCTLDANTAWVANIAAFKIGVDVVNTDYSPGVGSSLYAGATPLLNPQAVHPASDASAGGWTTNDGSGTLASKISEAARDDASYIQSASNPSGDTCTIKLASFTLPGTNAGFHFQWAAGATGATGTVVGSLRQGNSPGTEVVSWTHANLPVGSYQEFDDPITSAQAANFTDPTDVYLRIVAS